MRRARNLERRHTLAFALSLVALVATSWLRATGDGGEYLAMALEIGAPGSPALSTGDIDRDHDSSSRAIGPGARRPNRTSAKCSTDSGGEGARRAVPSNRAVVLIVLRRVPN